MTLTGKKNGYTLLAKPDDDPPNPRSEWENFGTMVCFHRRYDLGDKHNFSDSSELLQELFVQTVGGGEQGEAMYGRLLDKFDTPEYGGYGSHAWARAVDNALLSVIRKKNVVLPVHLYDHSGLTVSTRPFSCPWDSGQVGWIHASRDTILEAYGGQKLTRAKLERAQTRLRGEVDEYDHYLRGDCVGFELYKGGKMEDSCWGILGSGAELRAVLEDCMPTDCKGITETLAERHARAPLRQRLQQAGERARDTPKPPPAPGRDALQI